MTGVLIERHKLNSGKKLRRTDLKAIEVLASLPPEAPPDADFHTFQPERIVLYTSVQKLGYGFGRSLLCPLNPFPHNNHNNFM